MNEPSTECTCPGPKAALHYALAGTEPPDCAQHRATPDAGGTPVALNNNAALGARLLGTLNESEQH